MVITGKRIAKSLLGEIKVHHLVRPASLQLNRTHSVPKQVCGQAVQHFGDINYAFAGKQARDPLPWRRLNGIVSYRSTKRLLEL